MRSLVDIPTDDLRLLNRLSKQSDTSRAELVRRAIAAYLEPHRLAEQGDGFGLWADQAEDGLFYQERTRGEW